MPDSGGPDHREEPAPLLAHVPLGLDPWLKAWEQYGGSKRRILDVASRLFAERGYVGTSLKDIALAAGMTAGNVYNHFQSKEEVLFTGIAAAGETLWATLQECIDATMSPSEHLLAAIYVFLSYSVTPTPWLSFGQELRWITDSDRREVLYGHRDRLEHFFRQLVAGHTGRPVDGPEVFLGTAALLSFILGTRRWYRPEGRSSLSQIAVFALRMLDASREPLPA